MRWLRRLLGRVDRPQVPPTSFADVEAEFLAAMEKSEPFKAGDIITLASDGSVYRVAEDEEIIIYRPGMGGVCRRGEISSPNEIIFIAKKGTCDRLSCR